MNSIRNFYKNKEQGKKICMITCYDYTSARIISDTDIDCILVGDSAVMTMHGYQDTVFATLDLMQLHIQAVHRGCKNKFIIGDLPFLSYRIDKKTTVGAAQRLIQAGANAVKLEGAKGNLKYIAHLVESGIPVMGHIGLTPQLVNQLGGYHVQGKSAEEGEQLKQDALALQAAGCFALVLECVPSLLAKEISLSLKIPTIGIGAGPDTDGQVLVWQDLLGLNLDFKPKFVKQFIKGSDLFSQAIQSYTQSVRTGEFPEHANCY